MATKERLSASIDAGLLARIQRAAEESGAPSVSSWLEERLEAVLRREERRIALRELVADYFEDDGLPSEEEVERSHRELRSRATVVRPSPR